MQSRKNKLVAANAKKREPQATAHDVVSIAVADPIEMPSGNSSWLVTVTMTRLLQGR